MDSGLAVVIGAVVAFLGSIIGSVLGPRWAAERDRKSLEARERREAVRTALLDIVHGFGLMRTYRFEGSGTPAFPATILAITKLGLSITKSEAQIEKVALHALNRIQIAGETESAVALGAFSQTCTRWSRGEIADSKILSAYTEQTESEVRAAAEHLNTPRS